MKKFTFLIALSLFTLAARAQVIMNAGFETWVQNNECTTPYQIPQHWVTSDVFVSFFNEVFGNMGYNAHSVTQTTSSHSGNYAVEMSVSISSGGDTVGGAIYYSDSASRVLLAAFNAGSDGFPFSSRPANLTGYYKWQPVGGDSAGIYLAMTKWNTTTQSRDTVSVVSYTVNPQAAWTQFTIPIPYQLGVYPDTVFIGAGILNSSVHLGSVYTVDDFAFTGTVPASVHENAANHAIVTSAPNPFTAQTTLTFNNAALSDATFELYDVLGNKVRVTENISGSSMLIERENLPQGIYFYTLTDKQTIIVTGKLTIQ